ncbi:MAG: enoyl-CoA hydratase [Bacillus sp. (in: firmicutes)]
MLTNVEYVSQTDVVKVTKDERILTIELNRPEAMNAMDAQLLKELTHVLKQAAVDDSIAIVVLKGAGKAFSAGGDIKMMLSSETEKDFDELMDCVHALAVTLYTLPKLTISALHGAAAGLGLSVALATDYIIADQQTKIAMNFIGIGLIPDGGGHFFLNQRIGEVKAKQLIWEGKVMAAEEAQQREIIQEVAEYSVEDAVRVKISEWLHKPLLAMIETKKILAEGNLPLLIQMLELEKEGQLAMRRTADHQEGITAFVEKRKPNFIGR